MKAVFEVNFADARQATLDALFHCVKTQIYRKGDEIVKQGAAVECMHTTRYDSNMISLSLYIYIDAI